MSDTLRRLLADRDESRRPKPTKKPPEPEEPEVVLPDEPSAETPEAEG